MKLDWLDILINQAPKIEEVFLPEWEQCGLRLLVKRDDLLHPLITGNKMYKLGPNLFRAAEQSYSRLLSFGGAHSNHLFGLAAAGALSGVETIGVVRGEKPKNLSPTLLFCQSQGMILHFVSRAEYKFKTDAAFIQQLERTFGRFYLIQEGGTNAQALHGTSQILADIEQDYDVVVLACGTGGTLAGIAMSLPADKKLIGIPVLKNAEFLYKDINLLINLYTKSLCKAALPKPYLLLTGFAEPGYAKSLLAHLDFKSWFEEQSSIPLDKVYTTKLFYALHSLALQNYFRAGTTVLAIHTGGYQAENL